MIALSVAKLKNVFAGKRNFSLNRAKMKKKNFFVESYAPRWLSTISYPMRAHGIILLLIIIGSWLDCIG